MENDDDGSARTKQNASGTLSIVHADSLGDLDSWKPSKRRIEVKTTDRTYTIRELIDRHITKGELFKGFPGTFDYALPQAWLHDFSLWAINRYGLGEDPYHLILGTTVWAYGPDQFGPVSLCSEVAAAIDAYNLEQ